MPADLPATRERTPWRGVVVGLLAAMVFIVGLAVTAYATRDRAGPVRPPAPDAGVALDDRTLPDPTLPDQTGKPVDAGEETVADASEVATAEPEPDAGPVGALGPPVELSVVSTTAQPILQACLSEALRFDPSFGGRITVRVEVRGRTLRVRQPPGASPVFGRCLEQRSGRLDGAPTSANAALLVQLDGLRGVVVVLDAQLVE